jgi:hypothetical protein
VFQAVKALAAYGQDFNELRLIAQKLAKDNLPELVRLADFRTWLEENTDYGLEDMLNAVGIGARGGVDRVYVCRSCHNVFRQGVLVGHSCQGHIMAHNEARNNVVERHLRLR